MQPTSFPFYPPMVKNNTSSRPLYMARQHGYFSLHSVHSATSRCLQGNFTTQPSRPSTLFFFSSQKTHTLPHHSFGHPTWSRLIIGHRPVHSDWSSNATGPKLRQSETRSSGTTGEDSLLLNLVKGVSPKQPATLSHIMGRNLRKSEEEQAMLQARGQVPKQPRCPDAVSCRPTHQSSKPLSNLNWPSTARY